MITAEEIQVLVASGEGVAKQIAKLKKDGVIKRDGSRKLGIWILIGGNKEGT